MMILDIWNTYICTAAKKRNKEILTAKNTTELVVENRILKKNKKNAGLLAARIS